MMLRQGQQAVTSYSRDVIDRIILVAFHGTTVANGLKLCTLLAPRAKVHIAGFVMLPEAKSLSEGTANAGRMRRSLSALRGPGGIKLTASVHVCHDPLEHLSTLVARRRSSLVVLDCTEYPSFDDPIIQRIMAAPPADIALLRGEPQVDSPKLLVPVRGGPYAELALRLALSIHRSSHGMLTVMSIRLPSGDPSNSNQSEENAAFASIEQILESIPEAATTSVVTSDISTALVNESHAQDLVFLGFSGPQTERAKVSTYKGVTVVEEFNRSLKTIQYTPGHLFLSVDEVAERVRPPMMEIPEYALRRQSNSTHLASSRSNGLER